MDRRSFLSSAALLPLAAVLPTQALAAVSSDANPFRITVKESTLFTNGRHVPRQDIEIHVPDNIGRGLFYWAQNSIECSPWMMLYFRIENGCVVGEETANSPVQTTGELVTERLEAIYDAAHRHGYRDFAGGDPDGWFLSATHVIPPNGKDLWSLNAFRQKIEPKRLGLIMFGGRATIVTA